MPEPRLGAYLRMLLERRGISQKAFGVSIGKSPGWVSLVLADKHRPQAEQVEAMADAVRASPDERQVLRRLALLSRTPTEIEQDYRDLKRRLGEHELEDFEGEQPPSQ